MYIKPIGFSAIEMMVVIAIIAILASISIPSQMGRIIKEQVIAAIPLTDIAKEPIAASWKAAKTLPADSTETGLPTSEKVVNNFVSALEVKNGVINITFRNKAHPKIAAKVLSFRPAVIVESQIVPVAWVCGNAKAPYEMIIKGENKTTEPSEYLPQLCR